jgi:Domain of unknown function (DUF3846)
MKALVLTTTGEIKELDGISLQDLQSAVGGWVQAIDLSNDLTMWLNEEGKLTGLPHNTTAQKLWDKTFWVGSDFVVGDVVLTGGTDEEGVTLPLGDDTAQRVRKILVAS